MSHRVSKTIAFASQLAALVTVLIFVCAGAISTCAQSEDTFGDSPDPVKLFERGQNAHARGDLIKALEFYDEAIKVRPEFAEAEFQRANALTGLSRLPEAEASLRRTIELRKNWSLPYASLGSLLIRLKRDPEAEAALREAIKLERNNNLALRLLADIRLRAGDAKQAVELARRATADNEAPAATWILRALAERAAGDNVAALAALAHVLQLDPENVPALLERAEIRIATADKELAYGDLKAAEILIKGDKTGLSRLAADYQLAGKLDDAQRVAEAAGITQALTPANPHGVIGTPGEIAAANSSDAEIERKALEVLLVRNPKNAMLLARLGAAYRTLDPRSSLDYYKRAATIEPANVDYATGYSSALVQARRFGEAVEILRRVIADAPQNYAAHANLATALYESKQYPAALAEYDWLLKTKPDLAVAYYFIATAHDYLGEYDEALSAYEMFIGRADVAANQLEIEKVKLRLPSLRRQIQLGQGTKRKTARTTPD
jgi:tetratricopeptide (TPR) repeat protein